MQLLGYACINTELAGSGISVNRGMIKKTFNTKGLTACAKLAELNLLDLLKIIEWNEYHAIRNYRMSSSLFPWMTEYEIADLPNFHYSLEPILQRIGSTAVQLGHKLSFHPGQFDCLASTDQKVVDNTIVDLEQHSRIMDLLGLPTNHLYNINIHVGGVYGDKRATLLRFASNFNRLSENLKKRLTVENDDTKNGYTVEDLLELHSLCGIPIVFDTLHWQCNPGKLTYEASFNLALSTWNNSIIPEIHHSSSKKIYEDRNVQHKAHADFIYEKANTLDREVYVTIESKMKEQALLKYRTEYLT